MNSVAWKDGFPSQKSHLRMVDSLQKNAKNNKFNRLAGITNT
jgi:hypothetical protein